MKSGPSQPPLSLSLPSQSTKQPNNLFSHGSLNLTQAQTITQSAVYCPNDLNLNGHTTL
jgi:hypothetical protein